MRFMQIELALQTKNRSEPAKNQFSVALIEMYPHSEYIYNNISWVENVNSSLHRDNNVDTSIYYET